MTTTLHSIPSDLEATVQFHYDTVSCTLAYPCIPTSLPGDDVLVPEISIYPNPFHDEAVIELGRLMKDVSFDMLNAMGSPVHFNYKSVGNKIIIERGDLPAGIYYCRIMAQHQIIAAKCLLRLD